MWQVIYAAAPRFIPQGVPDAPRSATPSALRPRTHVRTLTGTHTRNVDHFVMTGGGPLQTLGSRSKFSARFNPFQEP